MTFFKNLELFLFMINFNMGGKCSINKTRPIGQWWGGLTVYDCIVYIYIVPTTYLLV